jgi:hypothetical protein
MTQPCRYGLKPFELGPSNSTSSTGRDLETLLKNGISITALPRFKRSFQVPPETPRRLFPVPGSDILQVSLKNNRITFWGRLADFPLRRVVSTHSRGSQPARPQKSRLFNIQGLRFLVLKPFISGNSDRKSRESWSITLVPHPSFFGDCKIWLPIVW